MILNLESLPLGDLEHLYEQAQKELKRSLIDGADWKSVNAQRELVTDLAQIIHKRKHPLEIPSKPAEHRPESERSGKPN